MRAVEFCPGIKTYNKAIKVVLNFTHHSGHLKAYQGTTLRAIEQSLQ